MKGRPAVNVTDVQGDFTTWKTGSLAVPHSDEAYVKNVDAATRHLREAGFLIVATQDWHPRDHISFASNHPGKKPFETIQMDGRTQVLWPDHCVQGTEGARILLDNKLFAAIIQKGMDPKFDSYSGFRNDGGAKTEMEAILRAHGIASLIIYGMATDYCVRATALDAVKLGFRVIVLEALCRGITPDTTLRALQEMREAGIVVMKELDIETITSLT